MTIHKEGHKMLLTLILILTALNIFMWWYLPDAVTVNQIVGGASLILFLAVLQFFRNPKIVTEVNPKHIIAPADGKVVVIEETEETEYLKEKRIQISIFMSPTNVHVNRNPISGIVKYFKYHPGLFLVAWHPKSSTDNERTTYVVENEMGIQILFRQIAGAMARRIRWYANVGDQVTQGNEFGFIKFGSRVDVFVPVDADIKVNLDQPTKGGRTVLAELK